MALAFRSIRPLQEEEWHEVQAVLQSGILKKAPNLQSFLEFVADKHFAGTAEDVKEYSIAVYALHRPEQFDPQYDTIVRVTAHLLRKKLEQYYGSEGATHRVHIHLPVGRYVLQFERQRLLPTPVASVTNADVELPAEEPVKDAARMGRYSRILRWIAAIASSVVLLLFGIAFQRHRRAKRDDRPESYASNQLARARTGALSAIAVAQDRSIRVRFGANPRPYVDASGQTWSTDQYCQGGSAFSHPHHEVQGTDDPALFQEGREGRFQCRIPVPSGTYQLQLLFADTAGDKEGARQVDFSINDQSTAALDIVDEAGGNDVVVGKVYAGIHPMSDGTIHLDFTSAGSFVNAMELLSADSPSMLPFRMLAGPVTFHDDRGNTWLPERFFIGGRRTFRPENLPNVASAKLFQWERYGNFRYLLPVVPGKQYSVRFYLSEGWFGASNGGPGGVGSREFDIYCNGVTLFKDFDIFKVQKNGAAVITSHGVKPTTHGMLDIHFTPGKNYPLINAIEVTPEG